MVGTGDIRGSERTPLKTCYWQTWIGPQDTLQPHIRLQSGKHQRNGLNLK